MIGIVEIILLVTGVVLSALWINAPEKSYEPAIVLIFGFLAAIEAYRRHQESNSLRLITEKLMAQVERLEETIKQLISTTVIEGDSESSEEDVIETVEAAEGLLLCDAFSPASPPGLIKIGKVGIEASSLKQLASRGMFNQIAQFYHLVLQGLLLSKHIYRGLLRPMQVSNTDDNLTYVYAWKPKNDVAWDKENKKVIFHEAPKNCVFVVYVQVNSLHPELIGLISHWSWVEEDPSSPESPINWQDRYESVQFEANRA